MSQDPLHFWPVSKWGESMEVFKADWPRGIPGFTVLEYQKEWIEKGLDYGFKVYVPYGDARNGIVGVNKKHKSYELVIQCPKDDTTKLAKALKITKMIDWSNEVTLAMAPSHVIKCVKSLFGDLNLDLTLHIPSQSFYLDKNSPLFEEVSLPAGITFDFLRNEHVQLIDACWPHRYPGSDWYFELLIKAKSGYGLFLNKELISWMLVNEFGILTHVFTLEEHRKRGYSEKLLKLVSNILLKDNKYVYAFCVAENTSASSLYKKVGFHTYNEYEIGWCWIDMKNK